MQPTDGTPENACFPIVVALPWVEQAVCRGLDANLFFPQDGDGNSAAQAKAICHTCPVESECLAFALDEMEKHGIWGGTNEKERRAMRRGRRAVTLYVRPIAS